VRNGDDVEASIRSDEELIFAPGGADPDFDSLIGGLLLKAKGRRIASVAVVKGHNWFGDVHFDDILAMRVPAYCTPVFDLSALVDKGRKESAEGAGGKVWEGLRHTFVAFEP